MNDNWQWAELDSQKLNLLKEAEQTLGADILLAYQQGEPANVQGAGFSRFGIQVADLNDSQTECLQGLEDKIQAVVIAYQQPGA